MSDTPDPIGTLIDAVADVQRQMGDMRQEMRRSFAELAEIVESLRDHHHRTGPPRQVGEV